MYRTGSVTVCSLAFTVTDTVFCGLLEVPPSNETVINPILESKVSFLSTLQTHSTLFVSSLMVGLPLGLINTLFVDKVKPSLISLLTNRLSESPFFCTHAETTTRPPFSVNVVEPDSVLISSLYLLILHSPSVKLN